MEKKSIDKTLEELDALRGALLKQKKKLLILSNRYRSKN